MNAILFEDENYVFVNKTSGVPSHTLAKTAETTSSVESQLLSVGIQAKAFHRLDTLTSGALGLAKNETAFLSAREALSKKSTEKFYLAWVPGMHEGMSGDVSFYAEHSPKSKRRMLVSKQQEKTNKTWLMHSSLRAVFASPERTLFLVQIHTGVTHQVRLTLSSLGAAIFNDPIYKTKPKPLQLKPLNERVSAKFAKMGSLLEIRPDILAHNHFLLHSLSFQFLEGAFQKKILAAPPAYFGVNLKK